MNIIGVKKEIDDNILRSAFRCQTHQGCIHVIDRLPSRITQKDVVILGHRYRRALGTALRSVFRERFNTEYGTRVQYVIVRRESEGEGYTVLPGCYNEYSSSLAYVETYRTDNFRDLESTCSGRLSNTLRLLDIGENPLFDFSEMKSKEKIIIVLGTAYNPSRLDYLNSVPNLVNTLTMSNFMKDTTIREALIRNLRKAERYKNG
tara:strand:- start:269 stop:883 length:615 start_codon:yes stop_codon:yes gene_type:complete